MDEATPMDEEALRLYPDTGSFLAAAFSEGLAHIYPCSELDEELAEMLPLPRQPAAPPQELMSRVLAPTASHVFPLPVCRSFDGSPTSDVTVQFPAAPLIVFDLEETLSSRRIRGDEGGDALSRCFGGARRLAMLDAALAALCEAGASLAIFSLRTQAVVQFALGAPNVGLLRHFERVVCPPDGGDAESDRTALMQRSLLRGQPARTLCVVDSRAAGLKDAAACATGCRTLLARNGGLGPAELRELLEWVGEVGRVVYRSDDSDEMAEPDCRRSPWFGGLAGDTDGMLLSRGSPSWELP